MINFELMKVPDTLIPLPPACATKKRAAGERSRVLVVQNILRFGHCRVLALWSVVSGRRNPLASGATTKVLSHLDAAVVQTLS